jgi:hypothetical protein
MSGSARGDEALPRRLLYRLGTLILPLDKATSSGQLSFEQTFL